MGEIISLLLINVKLTIVVTRVVNLVASTQVDRLILSARYPKYTAMHIINRLNIGLMTNSLTAAPR